MNKQKEKCFISYLVIPKGHPFQRIRVFDVAHNVIWEKSFKFIEVHYSRFICFFFHFQIWSFIFFFKSKPFEIYSWFCQFSETYKIKNLFDRFILMKWSYWASLLKCPMLFIAILIMTSCFIDREGLFQY